MEAFHSKRPTPIETLSHKRSRRTIELHRECVSEIGAASLGCNKKSTKQTTSAIKLKTNTAGNTSSSDTNTYTLLRLFSLPQVQSHLPVSSASSAAIYHQHIRRNSWSSWCSRHDLASIMMTMLFLISIVLSGNSALAAQRETFKHKDTNSLHNNGNNGNAILNEIASNSASSANGGSLSNLNSDGNNENLVSHSKVNNSNIQSNRSLTGAHVLTPKTTTTFSTSTSTSTSSSAGAGAGAGGYATTATAHVSSGSSSSSGGSSGSYKSASSSRNSIDLQEASLNGPYFDKGASKNVTALLGKTAYLNCRVKNLGNKTMLLQVSWVRHRDIHLLTVGRYTYTSDQRFRAIHQPQTEDWILQIKYPQHRDSGIYECQVSTTPHMSHYIHLNVVEPSTEIIGAPDLYIESGSTINLTCVILNSPEPPAYIFWNHNNAIINYDSPRGGVSVVTNKGETTTSFLLIKSARPSDSGHYQCNPSNAKPKSVTVHVLNGEFPAAMQRAALTHPRMSPSHYISVYLLMYLSTLAYARRFIRPPFLVPGPRPLLI